MREAYRFGVAEANPRWQHRPNLKAGYVRTRVGVDHPLADKRGYCYEHLLVWVSAGLPRPGPDELIHHVNGHKTDNRLANLVLWTRAGHSTYHRTGEYPADEPQTFGVPDFGDPLAD